MAGIPFPGGFLKKIPSQCQLVDKQFRKRVEELEKQRQELQSNQYYWRKEKTN